MIIRPKINDNLLPLLRGGRAPWSIGTGPIANSLGYAPAARWNIGGGVPNVPSRGGDDNTPLTPSGEGGGGTGSGVGGGFGSSFTGQGAPSGPGYDIDNPGSVSVDPQGVSTPLGNVTIGDVVGFAGNAAVPGPVGFGLGLAGAGIDAFNTDRDLVANNAPGLSFGQVGRGILASTIGALPNAIFGPNTIGTNFSTSAADNYDKQNRDILQGYFDAPQDIAWDEEGPAIDEPEDAWDTDFSDFDIDDETGDEDADEDEDEDHDADDVDTGGMDDDFGDDPGGDDEDEDADDADDDEDEDDDDEDDEDDDDDDDDDDYHTGGLVDGPTGDTIRGEFVVRGRATKAIGAKTLAKINAVKGKKKGRAIRAALRKVL